MIDDLHVELRQLARAACAFPQGSRDRNQSIDQIVQKIQRSGRLWRGSNLSDADYRDMVQQSWLYLVHNLCEPQTARAAYDPKQASLITWLNAYLKMRVLDARLGVQREQQSRVYEVLTAEGQPVDPIAQLPAPTECPPILKDVLNWVDDSSAELSRIYVQNRPDLNCKTLILLRLPPQETPWKQLAQEFDAPEATLRGFYRSQCLPRLRAFGQQAGYLSG
jgi:hypothetical protein